MSNLKVIDQYKKLHENQNFCRGSAIKGYFKEIKAIIDRNECRTLLDYGCGKAMHYSEGVLPSSNWDKEWGVTATLYDPGVEKFNKKPEGKFDMVICTDVLEHVEDPGWAVKDIFSYPTKAAFIQISTVPSDLSNPKRRLLDGRGLHISIYPEAWWIELIDKHKPDIDLTLLFTNE